MDGIAAASVQDSTSQVQQAAQIDMLKKSNDSAVAMAAQVLASAQVAPAAPSPSGLGQLIDRRV